MKENKNIKNEQNSKNNDVNYLHLVEKKLDFFKNVIQKTTINAHKNKTLDILGVSDVSICVERLTEINYKIQKIFKEYASVNSETIINNLQTINNELSSIFSHYGTDSLDDLLHVCFGNNNKITHNSEDECKFELLNKYFHPTGYKVIIKKDEKNFKTQNEFKIYEKSKNLDCFDGLNAFKQFHMKVYGIKLFITNKSVNKSLIIYGVLDDVMIDFLNNKYISEKQTQIYSDVTNELGYDIDMFHQFVDSLTLKDYLVNEKNDIFHKFVGYVNQLNNIKQKPISQTVKEFISDDLYSKRLTLIQLLLKPENYESQYLAYLLYDILSNESNGIVDTQEQTIIFDSFPWKLKQTFKNAMKKTIQYTNELSNFEMNKIPIEQQICLLKADDSVKEKAMVKLKEVKAKSEDSGSKARQYLDGLLKIPFSIYKREPILYMMDTVRNEFKLLHTNLIKTTNIAEIPEKEKYTSLEIIKYMKNVNVDLNNMNYHLNYINSLKKHIIKPDKKGIISNIEKINELLMNNNLSNLKINFSDKKKSQLNAEIDSFIDNIYKERKHIIPVINNLFVNTSLSSQKTIYQAEDINKITSVNNKLKKIKEYMVCVKETLDKAVYGHNKAKNQIERIIGQWINGEQDGYCFGFEGPPGVGKTSLAKRGLSNCLKDEKNDSRPFSMIQMGGDSNGSTLHGHNYTYVGSTWGSIVQILIDKKCMNPIIFIDEVDKISRTEHGKEIVGILTHLLDPTQNDIFQDKYFTGIDLDLSKALFILSYNDVEAIDKILLDRIHRIKFSNLSLEDKLIISKTHILPEVYKKMGLEEMVNIDDEVLKFIIDEYTSEAGVRKLKEILFEIVGEINLEVLKNNDIEFNLPIVITIEEIKTKYFKDKREIKNKKIHKENKIGIINGLWANSQGKGGVIPIQTSWRPSDKFLTLHLTGLQGDVMKESMNVALTLAWGLTPIERKSELLENQLNNVNGVHIHCPEGSVPKDGPSAGTAITIALYSLLNQKKIKHNIAITGEISLDGFVTEIGGLDLKILGGIKAGITEFLFPEDNAKDFNSFLEKYKDTSIMEGIVFRQVKNIQDVIDVIFED